MATQDTTPALPPLMPDEILESIPVLEEGPPAESLEPAGISPWILWGGLFVIIMVVAPAIYCIVRAKQRKPRVPTAEETALQELRELSKCKPDTRTCSLALSRILREYLTGKTQDPALYETHEEFSHRLDALSSIPTECQYDVRMLLEKSAELKYTGIQEENAELIAALIAETEQTILHIHEARQREAEENQALQKVKRQS